MEQWEVEESERKATRPVADLGEDNKSRSKSMSLLVTLPIDTTICPLLPAAAISDGDHNLENDDELGDHQTNDSIAGDNREFEGSLFKSFCLEDYAWRVYHERLHFKDPLDRFRIKN